MTNNDNGNIDDVPGIGLDTLKRRPVGDRVFETTLSVAQCKAIVAATARHDVNFRPMKRTTPTSLLIDTMKRDLWVWTDADPIRLHLHVASGEVVCSDGQHRLYAATRARRTLRTLVLWGDDWRAGLHVDRNKARNVAQFLHHEHGITSPSLYVAAARLHLSRVHAFASGLTANYARVALVDDEQIITFVLANRDVLHWSINHGAAATRLGFSMTGYLVFLYELSTINREFAEAFHTDLLDKDLTPTDPLAQLRRAVGRRFNDTGIRSTVSFTLGNLVKAHNLRSAGETISRWVNVQDSDVTFPAGFRLNNELVKGANR